MLDGEPVNGQRGARSRLQLAEGPFERIRDEGNALGSQDAVAWFAIRSRLPEDLGNLPNTETIVLTSPDGALAQLVAAESTSVAIMVLAGGTAAWAGAGLPLETGASHVASEPEDVVLSARERGQGREEAMREYLAWEIDLVNQMATDDDQRFQVVTI